MIIASNLEKSFGPQVLFNSVSFLINPGERIGLVGKNGTGKSTLFKMILGNEKYDSGTLSTPKGYRIGAPKSPDRWLNPLKFFSLSIRHSMRLSIENSVLDAQGKQ